MAVPEFDKLLKAIMEDVKGDATLSKFEGLKTDNDRINFVLNFPRFKNLKISEKRCEKCDKKCEKMKNNAEDITSKNHWEVLKYYNAAIKFAPAHSTYTPFLYASRSGVLYSLQFFSLALKDIARSSNYSLPIKTTINLQVIKGSCYLSMEKWSQAESTLLGAIDIIRSSSLNNVEKVEFTGEILPKLKYVKEKLHNKNKEQSKPNHGKSLSSIADFPTLDYGPNPNIPAASSALKFNWTPEKGRGLFANQDIKIGSVVIVEKPFAWTSSREAMMDHCLHCCNYTIAPIPCLRCSSYTSSTIFPIEEVTHPLARNNAILVILLCMDYNGSHLEHSAQFGTAQNMNGKSLMLTRELNPLTSNGQYNYCDQDEVCFCDEECREKAMNKYHIFECPILDHILESKDLSCMGLLVYRIIVTANTQEITRSEMAPVLHKIEANENITSVESKLHFISESLHCDETEQSLKSIPVHFSSESYSSVYNQVTNTNRRSASDLFKRTVTACFLLRCFQSVVGDSKDEMLVGSRLLTHLQSCACNAYQISEQVVPQGDIKNSKEAEIGGAVYPTVSLCNHSCSPNVVRHSKGRGKEGRVYLAAEERDRAEEGFGWRVREMKPQTSKKQTLKLTGVSLRSFCQLEFFNTGLR
ncbi:unnamed protein product [Timema podura]|uniref:SET domain-containing protein n=1 Tax=Timema podura TaxID=61482 RepID=A0ABN7NTH5_TIMPD|nr:unnamed protein product [Timema podura]